MPKLDANNVMSCSDNCRTHILDFAMPTLGEKK